MTALIDMYGSWFRLHLAHALQYRAMIVLWQLAGLVEVLVALSVWTAVTKATGGSVGGYDRADFVAYFVLVMLVGELTHTWIVWMWEWRVREGTFAAELVKPVHPLHSDLADNAAVKLLSMSIKTPIAVIVAWLFGARFQADLYEYVWFAVALMQAWLLRALIESVLACIAFWLTRVAALVHAYGAAFLFLSGGFAPIVVLPPTLRDVAEVLPFRWVIDFPAQLAMGRLEGGEIAIGLAAQSAWIVVTFAAFRATWSLTARHFSAVGT